jgi:hypothetical protein
LTAKLTQKERIMLPRQSPPVARPFLFPIALQLVSRPSKVDPKEIKKTWEVVTGADPDPNDPAQFLYPVSCFQDCSILSGVSFMQCMMGCR